MKMDEKIIESGVSGKLLEWVEAHGYNGEYTNEGTISCSCVKQWLRKKYNIHIEVHVDCFNNRDTYYLIVMLHRCYNHLRKEGFNSYEEAELYGIQYCYEHNLLD